MMLIYYTVLTTAWFGSVFPLPQSHRCPRNEHFVVNSSSCQVTCAERYVSSSYCQCNPYTGCVCNKGYVRLFSDSTGPCIPPKLCPPELCLPTCAVPNPPDCPYIDYNVCGKGRILSEIGGECIDIEDCSEKNCNGDPNAVVKKCPLPCPSSCDAPNAVKCLKLCEPVGCECKPGYLLTGNDGQCVLPEKCPGGYPCNANETFVPCKIDCVSNNCPKDDCDDDIVCELPNDCLSGCVCKKYYKHKNEDDRTCILAEDCPPVKCTRPNEVWDSCPDCDLDEYCESTPRLDECDNKYCDPRCICKENYFRDKNNICVPVEECPPERCLPTCAVPNPTNCSYIDYDVCKPGYILSEIDGDCIKIKDCPGNQGCNGDLHAVVKECPLPCPSTCDEPDAVNCLKQCDPVGCECEPGYIRSENNGKCIPPEDCPCGYPCGGNQTFLDCKTDCSSDYCPDDDSLDNIMCKITHACLSGCSCNFNYRYRSEDDKTCILAKECPPVYCSRKNEVWNSCPPCDLYENCEDEDRKDCDTDVCIPRCICEENFYRNNTGCCVPPEECPDYDFYWEKYNKQ